MGRGVGEVFTPARSSRGSGLVQRGDSALRLNVHFHMEEGTS